MVQIQIFLTLEQILSHYPIVFYPILFYSIFLPSFIYLLKRDCFKHLLFAKIFIGAGAYNGLPRKQSLRWRFACRKFIGSYSQEQYFERSERSRIGQREKINCNMVEKKKNEKKIFSLTPGSSWARCPFRIVSDCGKGSGPSSSRAPATEWAFPKGRYLPWWVSSPSSNSNFRRGTQLWATPKWNRTV